MLNISGKLDRRSVETYRVIAEETRNLGIDYVVIGASARDLVLHFGYDVDITRATTDLDFAIEVGDWDAFWCLKDNLSKRGLIESKQQQRMQHPEGHVIDIVPFGNLADETHTIRWPPENEFEMSVLGFPEACAHSDWIRLDDDPVLDIPVVSPEGLFLLKLISWSDRAPDIRIKDATDIRYLLRNYDRLPADETGIYDIALLEQHDGDTEAIAAYLMGKKAGALASENTGSYVLAMFQGVLRDKLSEELIGNGEDVEYASKLLQLIEQGFVESNRARNA